MNPTNLFEYYKSQGQNLPSIADRTSIAREAGITEPYQGTAQQNTQLLSYLQQPKTTAPVATGTPADTTGTGVTETIGSAFNFSNPAVNETNPIVSQYNTYNEKLARGEDIVDTEAIRRQKLADVQDRINALNQVYAGELARVRQVGQGNIGSGTAILASRGLAGSMRGEAIRTGITDQNLRAEQAVEAERNAAIQSILMDVNNSAQEEARLRKESMLAGGKAYIENLKGQEERKAGYTNNVVAQLISQGIDPKTMSPEELNGIASQLGVKSSDILSRYQQAVYEQSLLEQPEEEYFNLSEGQSRYRINPETGEVELLAEKGKTYAPKAGGGSGGGVSGGTAGITANQSGDPFIQSLINTKGGKSLTDTTIQKLDKGLTTLGQLGILQANVNGVKTGPIIGAFKSANPWDTQGQVIKGQLNAIVPNLARGVYGEVGVLTDNDIKTYSQTIPNLKSTEEVRNALLYITLDMIGKSIKNTLTVNAAAGRDVSGFIDIYTEMEQAKNSILASIPNARVPESIRTQGGTQNTNPDPLGLF